MFEFVDVVERVDGINSEKTLKRWANLIEKTVDFRFERRAAKNSQNKQYSYKVFSETDISMLQKIADLKQEGVNLEQAIEQVFLSDEEKKKRETILISKEMLESYKNEYRELVRISKKMLEEMKGYKQLISVMQEEIESLKNYDSTL